MSSLQQDLENCVLNTEKMLSSWTEFACKYAKANANLNVQIYRERLLSAFQKFDEVSREVDRIVFCSVDKSSNLAPEPPEVSTSQDNQPVESSDSSSQSSSTLSQPIRQTELPPEIGDQPRNARHLSPARLSHRFESRKNEVTFADGRKSSADFTVSNASDDENVIDLTVDIDSPLFLDIENVYSVSVDVGGISTCAKDSEQTDPNSSVPVSLTNPLGLNTDISERMPLSEQLFLSDEDEAPPRVEKPSQPNYDLLASPIPRHNTQSFFAVSPRTSRVTLSVPNRPTNHKNGKNLGVRFRDSVKKTLTRPKNFQRNVPPTFRCNLCQLTFETPILRRKHFAAMHPDINRTFCRGCGQHLRRFEAISHYKRCMVYKHKNHVDRIKGMRLVLNKPPGVLYTYFNPHHLERQRKLLEEFNDIDIPAVPPCWRVPKKIDAYFEATNWPKNIERFF